MQDMLPILLVAGPVVAAWAILWTTAGERSSLAFIALALSAAIGAVLGWYVLPFLLLPFPEQPIRPGENYSFMAAGMFHMALLAWMGGLAGLTTMLTLFSRRAAGRFALASGAMATAFAVFLAAVPDDSFVPLPFWWRLFIAQETAPFLYLSLAMVLWAVWLFGRPSRRVVNDCLGTGGLSAVSGRHGRTVLCGVAFGGSRGAPEPGQRGPVPRRRSRSRPRLHRPFRRRFLLLCRP
jgi:hypothetical protein